jgi:hypothetical protein
MQQPDVHDELRQIFAARVRSSFTTARICVAYARTARNEGATEELHAWMGRIRALRVAAKNWRRRAQSIAPVIVCLVCFLHGCAKAPGQDVPSRGFTSTFVVKASPDGSGIIWSLQFKSRQQYHAFLDTTAEGADRSAVRELIEAGMRLHNIVGCSAHEDTVTKLGDDGVAFVGSCVTNLAHATPAGGI